MERAGVWAMTHGQRRDVADMLDGLTPEQWAAQSLCGQWRVRDVAAHLAVTARMTRGRFLRGMAAAGFRFDAFSAKQMQPYAGMSPAELVAELRRTAGRSSGPPGPALTPLSEVVVHGCDVSHPLGIKRAVPAEVLVAVLDFYRDAQLLIGAKKRIAGLRLKATDIDWQHGAGPEVTGPAESLLLAMSGRRPALADLTGPGVAQLTQRM
jgi:uncharacterized protein (TIGR03083 family)